MTNLVGLKREVETISQKIHVKPKTYKFLWWGRQDQPHGVFYHSIITLTSQTGCHGTQTCEAVEYDEEVKMLKQFYNKMITSEKTNFMKTPDHPYSTFEKFLEEGRCKCGKHGADGKQPFRG